MPYRSILITLVTVTLALLALSLWMRTIAPMLAQVNASTQPSSLPGAAHPGLATSTTSSTQAERPDRQFKGLVKGVVLVAFVIICVLFLIGFFTTLRSWTRVAGKPKRTPYVDAWKIAGERLKPTAENTPTDEPPSSPDND
jgi:hypothetical protein